MTWEDQTNPGHLSLAYFNFLLAYFIIFLCLELFHYSLPMGFFLKTTILPQVFIFFAINYILWNRFLGNLCYSHITSYKRFLSHNASYFPEDVHIFYFPSGLFITECETHLFCLRHTLTDYFSSSSPIFGVIFFAFIKSRGFLNVFRKWKCWDFFFFSFSYFVWKELPPGCIFYASHTAFWLEMPVLHSAFLSYNMK